MASPRPLLRVRVTSGDVRASLLRPHQVLVSNDDAAQLSITSHSLWRLRTDATDTPLLQIVCDRRAPADGGLVAGVVQLHPWVLDVLRLTEGDSATLEAASASTHRIQRLQVAVVTRSPLRTTTSSSSSMPDTSSLTTAAAATYTLLPESVRCGLVNLKEAIARQLRAMYGDKSSVSANDLVPLHLLGETFVFRVAHVDYKKHDDQDEEVAALAPMEIDVLGSPEDRVVAECVADVETKFRGLQLSGDNDDLAFQNRVSSMGFCGYTSFLKETLFHIMLNFPSAESARVGQNGSTIQYLASRGLVLYGVPGVGKSLAIRVLDRELQQRNISTWRVDAMSLLMEYENSKAASPYDFLVTHIEQFLPSFRLQNPDTCGVVLIDDLHVLFQPTNGQDASDASDGDQSALLLIPLGSALLRLLDSMTNQTRLCIVGTATTSANDGSDDSATIPPVAKRSGRFDKLVEMIVPTETMRREVLTHHLRGLPLEQSADNLANRIAAITGGYVAKDLVRICRSAYVHAFSSHHIKSSTIVTWDHLVLAQRRIKPSQLQQLNVASPSTQLEVDSDGPFAGYVELQKQLCDFIDWKFHPSQAMKHLGVANASGLLIHGPSGCGKSLLVKALAAKARVNFVSVKSSELLSKYFGDSEKAVRQLFARARAASPCLLFFDEFDSIAHKRSFGGADGGGGDSSGVYARILSTFLNEMDGVGGSRHRAADVLVVAATNRMDALDAALIRPGRIDKSVELGYPQTHDCQVILEFYTRKMLLASDVDLAALARRSTGSRQFTGADLAAVCKEAAFRSLRENIDAECVAWDHFVAAWDQRVGL